MQIIYRKLRSDEARVFRQIRLECLENFPDKMGTSLEDEAGKAKLHLEALIEQEHPGVLFFGAFADDNLIGIAGFVRDNRIKTRHCGEIVSMYVKPDFQGHQVGEKILIQLLRAVFEWEGIEQAYLTVFADNSSAVGLYERVGFETFGVQRNYFKSGENYWHRQFMQLTKEKFLKKNENLD